MALFIKAVVIVSQKYNHGSIKVVAKISQRKKEQAKKCLWGILNASRVQPAILVEYSPNNRHHMIASNIHRSSLLHRKKVRLKMDQRSCPVNNLQKIRISTPVKYYLIFYYIIVLYDIEIQLHMSDIRVKGLI
jgi:hypothetical protein